MRRAINELTSDEVQRGTGMKVGDFGTGGRTYIDRHERTPAGRGAGNNSQTGAKCCFFGFAIAAVATLVYVEMALLATSECLDEALERAIPIPGEPIADSSRNGKLVFANALSTPTAIGVPPTDEFFGLVFPKEHATVRRVVEFCQWQEMQHTREIKEGRNPETGKDIIRRETTYTYHKAWRTNRINSLLFDNAAAYHNPQRDPAGGDRTFHTSRGIDLTGGKQANGLTISAADFQDGLLPWRTVLLQKQYVAKLGKQALQEGFNEADHQYVYSRVPKDGFTGSPIVKAAASYLIDGVVDVNEISKGSGFENLLAGAGLDWITKGTCNAGDIRVHFEARELPQTASVIALQTTNNQLAPFTYSNGHTRVFAVPTSMELPAMIKKLNYDSHWYTNLYRAGIALLFLFAALGGAEIYTPGAGFLSLWGLLCSASVAGVWAYLYGVQAKPAMTAAAIAAVSAVYVFMNIKKQNTASSSSGSGGVPAAPPAPAAGEPADNKAAYERERKTA